MTDRQLIERAVERAGGVMPLARRMDVTAKAIRAWRDGETPLKRITREWIEAYISQVLK